MSNKSDVTPSRKVKPNLMRVATEVAALKNSHKVALALSALVKRGIDDSGNGN